jgi:prolyl-tRNA synthetase
MTHGDDQGLVLPSKIAPDQVRIIPINNSDEVELKVQELVKNLTSE